MYSCTQSVVMEYCSRPLDEGCPVVSWQLVSPRYDSSSSSSCSSCSSCDSCLLLLLSCSYSWHALIKRDYFYLSSPEQWCVPPAGSVHVAMGTSNSSRDACRCSTSYYNWAEADVFAAVMLTCRRWRRWWPCDARALCLLKPRWAVLGLFYPFAMHTSDRDTSVSDTCLLSSFLSRSTVGIEFQSHIHIYENINPHENFHTVGSSELKRVQSDVTELNWTDTVLVFDELTNEQAGQACLLLVDVYVRGVT